MKKLLAVKQSHKPDKKYDAIFDIDGRRKVVPFGAKGMSDYTINHDNERKERYKIRHKKDLKTNDPTRAGYLSYYLLWNKPTLESSIRDYKNKFNF